MEFKVKKLANFTLKADGVFSKKFWIKKGCGAADAEKRSNERSVVFTVNNGLLTAQADPSGGGYIPFGVLGNHSLDAETLRNIADLAASIADEIEKDAKEEERVE